MTVSIEEAQSNLPNLIAHLPPNEDLVICDQGEPVARLSRVEKRTWPCEPGSAKDIPHWMAADFNAPLDEFREYVE